MCRRRRNQVRQAPYNWGIALTDQAGAKQGEEADRLFQLAGEKYAAAIDIKPDKHEALNNWGNAMINQSYTRQGDEAGRLLDQAEEKCLLAEEIQPGKGAYNLACIAALREDQQGCRQWLETCREQGALPDRAHLESDSDLDPVREADWFKEFLERF